MRRGIVGLSLALCAVSGMAGAQQNPTGLAIPKTAKVQDVFTPFLPQEVSIKGGFLGNRIDANAKNRMLKVDENDMLDCFERREVVHQDWQGEHVGKFLHAATLTWNYTHDKNLKVKLDRVVVRLLKTQEANGYLGTYKPDHRWTSWDVWIHKYDLIGLLTYYQFTRLENNGRPTPLGAQSLTACKRIGDLLISTFGIEPGKRDINKSGEHVGMAPDSVLEAIVLLYRATNEPRYLSFAQYVVSNYDAPGGPAILASLETKKNVKAVANGKAYEMMSNFNGLLELYRVTGERRLLDLMRTAWSDIAANRLYITGSASAGEHFQNEFHFPNGMNSNICETCVTVTWEQMNLELLRLTGDPRCADELEKSVYNHLLAAQKPTGDDWAYYTPLDGHKPYDNFTTCCHSSGPRGVALIPEIAYMQSEDGGIVVNFYNNGTVTTRLRNGTVTLQQTTSYPMTGDVTIKVDPTRDGQRFPLRLRIPPNTSGFAVTVNGMRAGGRTANVGYMILNRSWQKNDVVTITMTLVDRIHFGDHENAGLAAVTHGPLVLALDTEANRSVAPIRRMGLKGSAYPTAFPFLKQVGSGLEAPHFELQGSVAGKGKTTINLVPFADAGSDGKSNYLVWIPFNTPNLSADSLFSGNQWKASRIGNAMGDIADDDFATFAVTFNNQRAD